MLVTSLSKPLDDIRFVSQQSIQSHDFLPAITHPPEHIPAAVTRCAVTSFRFLRVFVARALGCIARVVTGRVKPENGILNVINLILKRLTERRKYICNVINDSVRYPIAAEDQIVF